MQMGTGSIKEGLLDSYFEVARQWITSQKGFHIGWGHLCQHNLEKTVAHIW